MRVRLLSVCSGVARARRAAQLPWLHGEGKARARTRRASALLDDRLAFAIRKKYSTTLKGRVEFISCSAKASGAFAEPPCHRRAEKGSPFGEPVGKEQKSCSRSLFSSYERRNAVRRPASYQELSKLSRSPFAPASLALTITFGSHRR